MSKLALVVGHTRNIPGVMGVSPICASEYKFNRELASSMETFSESRGHQVATFFHDGIGIEGVYQEVIKMSLNYLIFLLSRLNRSLETIQ